MAKKGCVESRLDLKQTNYKILAPVDFQDTQLIINVLINTQISQSTPHITSVDNLQVRGSPLTLGFGVPSLLSIGVAATAQQIKRKLIKIKLIAVIFQNHNCLERNYSNCHQITAEMKIETCNQSS